MLAILSDPGIGGTFLSWTVYYLSGKTHYYSARLQRQVEVPANPVSDKNAHNFIANQPYNFEDFDNFLPTLQVKNESMYMHPFRSNTQHAVERLCDQATKILALSLNQDQLLYQCKYAYRTDVVMSLTSQKKLLDPNDIYEDFVEYFFKDSVETWKKQNLTDIWDKREFIALNFHPFVNDSILKYMPSVNCWHLNAMDLWTNFDHSVTEVFDYLEIAIDKQRHSEWLAVYNQWKIIHIDRLKFVWYFETIIHSILNGKDFDLVRFNLDIRQEAAIQHCLIYQHNLNFKTWQLTKFTNTKQLHALLEPNIHDLKRLTT